MCSFGTSVKPIPTRNPLGKAPAMGDPEYANVNLKLTGFGTRVL